MSVSTHLDIDIREYDARILTFIPRYEEMLEAAAGAVLPARPRVVVDLGIGTAALSSRLAGRRPGLRIIGIDADDGMLAAARERLADHRASFVSADFVRAPLPRCDAVVASLALHHIASPRVKAALFRRARAALRRHGVLVSADCHPSALPARAAAGRRAWRDHLARSYGARRAERFLRTWAQEDFYTTLEDELRLLHSAGFAADIVWRDGAFAVIVAAARRSLRRHSGRRHPSSSGRRSSSDPRIPGLRGVTRAGQRRATRST